MAEEKETKKGGMDSKKMLKEAGAKNRKITYRERKKIEIIKDTKHYKKGDKYSPHTVMAEALIDQGIAKAAN